MSPHILEALGKLIGVLIMFLLSSAVVMCLYNGLPLPFEHSNLTYFQSMGLLILCNTLFKTRWTKVRQEK